MNFKASLAQPLHLAQLIGVIRQVPKKMAILGFWVPRCLDLCSWQVDLTDLFGGMARTGTSAVKQQLWCQPLHLAQVIGVMRQVPKEMAILGFRVPRCPDLCS